MDHHCSRPPKTLLQCPAGMRSRGQPLRLGPTLMGPRRMMTKMLERGTNVQAAVHDWPFKYTWSALEWHILGLSDLLGCLERHKRGL